MYRIITFKQDVYTDKPYKSRKLYDIEGNKKRYWTEAKNAADQVNITRKYPTIQEQWCVLEKYDGTKYVELERYPVGAPTTGPGHQFGNVNQTIQPVRMWGMIPVSQLIP